MTVAWVLIAVALTLVLYSYLLYPLILAIWSRSKQSGPLVEDPAEWPAISITVPMYNEERQARELLESLLQMDYPPDRRQILVVSDASTDGTDTIVAEYAGRGVELLRVEERRGKTAVENAARPLLRGDIVINTDASIRIRPEAIKRLVVQFRDPTVGVASGRDISVARLTDEVNAGEAGYVNYEMWVRDLESRVDGIVGASGCFYAIRRDLHNHMLPEALSRDFASALVAREHGFRAVSVSDAVCLVPRVPSLKREYRRKVRTITRGIETLFFKRHLMNPFRFGAFAWMLFSHKVCRWLVPWGGLLGTAGLVALATTAVWPRLILAAGVLVGLLGLIGWNWSEGRSAPRTFSIPAYALAGNIAAMHATINALRGELNPVWEPTRRDLASGHPLT